MYRTAGSIAFVAAARVAHIVAEDKQDPATRLFLPVKNNLAPNIGGLSFRIEAVNEQPRVAWNDLPVTMSADEALSLDKSDSKSQRLNGHKEWLAAQLAGGPKDADALMEQAKGDGISRNHLFAAKKELGAHARKLGFGNTSRWEWYLDAATGGTD
jgi:hypothetical protein